MSLNLPMLMYHPAVSYETSFVDGDFGEESNIDMHKSQLQLNQNKATRHATINDQHNFSSIAAVKALNLLDAVSQKHDLILKEDADVAEPAKSCGNDGAELGSTRIAAASGRSTTLTCLEVDVVTTESFDKASMSYVNSCSKQSKLLDGIF